MKDLNQKEFNELLGKVEELTSDNCHSEAFLAIADFFGYREYQLLFSLYSRKDSLTMEEYQDRHEAYVRMMVIIDEEFGSPVVKSIIKVL